MVKQPKRPKDPVSRAVLIGKMLVGDAPKDVETPQTVKQRAGAKGGTARAKTMPAAKRSEIAKAAAAKRWKK